MKAWNLILIFCGLAALPGQAQNRITTDTVGMRFSDTSQIVLPDTITVLTPRPELLITVDTLDIEVSGLTDTTPQSALSDTQLLAATLDASRTEAVLDVSASGGSTYTLPFVLPPGINDVVPELGLAYNSQGGNGIAGFGWNVYGLSGITRVGAAEYTDGRVGGVNFNLDDRFALDGQRLLLKSGTYGGDGAEYQTEQYSNLRIISRGVSPYGSNYGPAYFEVHYPDGSKAFYGQNANSRSRIQYGITYLENPQGVRISYEYNTSGNNLYIAAVSYGTRGTTPGINRVEFSYTTASRAEQTYVGGFSFYADRRISKVSVIAAGTDYRHYVPTYSTVATLNYQRMIQIQELNGNETSARAPIYFSYNNTTNMITSQAISNLSLTGIASNNSQLLTADFTGNGSMDFLLYPTAKNKFYAFYDLDPGNPYMQLGYEINTGAFREIFPATWLTWNEKVMPGQGMLLARNNGYNNYRFDVYSYSAAVPVLYQYNKLWDDPPLTSGYYSECDNMFHDGAAHQFEFVSGDFNGDGLTDVFAISRNQNIVTFEYLDYEPPWSIDDCKQVWGESGSIAVMIDMDRRKTTGYISPTSHLFPYFDYGDRIYAADFDGDGKTDILIVKNGSMHVFSLNDNNYLQLRWSTTDTRITNNNTRPTLLGDYNGDGKMDVMFATGYNNLFATFMSTGTGFVKHEKNEPFSNVENTWDGQNTMRQYVLIPTDINGDGKTDIVYARTVTYNSTPTGNMAVTIYHNTGVDANNRPIFGNMVATSRLTNVRHNPIPIFLNPNRQNPDLEYGYISDNTITLFHNRKDMLKESQVAQVAQDGVTHDIDYSRLMENAYGSEIPLYHSSYDETFPYIDIHYAPQLYVVDRMRRTALGQTAQQIFSYGKAVTNAEGLGFLGFGETIRSNLYLNISDPNRIFTIGIQSPQLRGANLRTFVSKSSYISPSIKNMALTAPPPAGGVPDGAGLADYISRQDLVYETDTLANKTFVNMPIATSAKDMLHGTYHNQRLQYDPYYNVTHTEEDINGEHTKRTGVTYANSTGATYYIGRPLSQADTLQHASDTYTTETQYSYTSDLPTQIRNKGHNTDFVIDSLTYDIFGNVTQRKTTVPGGAQRVESMEYDPSGRFMTKHTDPDGLENSYSYLPDIGQVQSSTDPYGRLAFYYYDSFARRDVWEDYVLNIYSEFLTRDGFNTKMQYGSNLGEETISVFDALGQKIEEKTKTVSGTWVGKAWQYDVYGRQTAESEPASPGNYTEWNSISYDPYGRIAQTVSSTGKTDTYTYSGLTTTVNDGVKSSIMTQDAMGQTVSVQDPGGTVHYTYFANGNLHTADYGGSVQTIEQDGWGHKTKLTDPSAGVYEYAYDGWGQLTEESTPKGQTNYVYDAAGKLTSRIITGDSTDMHQTYLYNPTNKLLVSSSLSNADGNHTEYAYSYDYLVRLTTAVEDNIHATFEKQYTYNWVNQLDTETILVEEKANNHQSSASWKHHYQHGQLEKITLGTGSQVIWEVDALNARGQLADISHGANLQTSLSYDTYGFPQQRQLVRTSGTPTTLMTLGTTFDAQRGFPTARSNSAFSWSETFGYDNLDRLTVFNDNDGNHGQQYDARGRIVENSRQGVYTYPGNSYRQDELELNPAADAYYQNRALQDISYNAFKAPVEIHEPGHDRISFQYNGALRRSHMYYGGEQVDPLARRYHRHYAEDGSAEITRDTQTGEVSLVLYLGGDAYSAPAIHKETLTGTGPSSAALYHLHRDYLGSIVMITDDAGTVMEKRQFDAWGNIVKLTDGNNNNLTNFGILDRGFTGHQHLLSVALIHMNGRLYDARLGRFLSPDNNVQDPFGTQNFNRYAYALNNPMIYVDPDGELWFIPIIIGAIIGGTSGYLTGKAQGAKGWDMVGYIMGGATIGAASGAAAIGISALGGGAMLSGAAAGAVGGGGFSGLATGWDGKAMLKGAGIGALSGFVGGGVASGIGGGWGSFAGGASSAGMNTLLYGGSGSNILNSMLLGGLMSYSVYELGSYINWNYGGGKSLGGQSISYSQYKTMQADFQRSRFWRKEYGGFLLRDGSTQRFPASWRRSHGIEPPGGGGINIPQDAIAMYHSHWDRPGKTIWVDAYGDRVDNNPLTLLSLLQSNSAFQTTTARGHGVYDYGPINSFVINRYETTFNIGGTMSLSKINDTFFRYFPFFNFWRR